jgi:copper chaperone CopZ
MKKMLALLLFPLFIHTATAQDNKSETVVIKTKIYCDHCLKCTSCGANIKQSIKQNKGIKKVSINPQENTISVTYLSTETNTDNIRKAITEAGFDADELKATADGYAKLDGCCKAR